MDDFVLFTESPAELRVAHAEIVAFLGHDLGLRLRPKSTILAPVRRGLPFLGWTLYRHTRRVRRANLQRSLKRIRATAHAVRRGQVDEDRYLQTTRSVLAHLASGPTTRLRRAVFESWIDMPAPP